MVATACTRRSGAVFPIGTTTVLCTAKEYAGNTGSAAFPVTVTPAAPALLQPVLGTDQVAAPGTGFASPLAATVTDLYTNPVPGIAVSFVLPPVSTTSGSASFGSSTASTAVSDASGTATSTVPTAGSAGPVVVTARTPGTAAAAWLLDVASALPARAGAAVALVGPSTAGGPFVVTTTNHGPQTAKKLATQVVLPAGWTVTDLASAQRVGQTLLWTRTTLLSGAEATYSFRVVPSGPVAFPRAAAYAATADPDYGDNRTR